MTEAAPPPPPAPGGGSTSGEPGQRVDEGKGRTFPCPSCGADLEFHIGVQSLRCPFCAHVEQLEVGESEEVQEQDFHAMLKQLAEMRRQPQPTAGAEAEAEKGDVLQEVRCSSCAANVQFQGTLTSSACPYCGSPIQREGVHDAEDRVPVDGVLPFLVGEPKARTELKQWLASRWFLPNDLKRSGIDERFSGVYLPYWTFDTMTANRYRGERGEYYYVQVKRGDKTHRERRTRWYPAAGDFQRFFDDVMATACGRFPQKILTNLEPWPLERCVPFNQQMLAGHFARTYDIELDKGFEDARQRIDAALYQEVKRRIGGDTQRVHKVDTRYQALTFKHLLLPVWLLAYRYGERSYQIAVNAATGEVQGQRPWSAVKIALAVLAVLAVVALVIVLANR